MRTFWLLLCGLSLGCPSGDDDPDGGVPDAGIRDAGRDTQVLDADVDTGSIEDGGTDVPDAGRVCRNEITVPTSEWREAYSGELGTFTFTNIGAAVFHVFEGVDCDTVGGCTRVSTDGGVGSGESFLYAGNDIWLLTDEATGATTVRVSSEDGDCNACGTTIAIPTNEWREAHSGELGTFTFTNIGAAVFHVFEGVDCDTGGCTRVSPDGGVGSGESFLYAGSDIWLLTDEATGATTVRITSREGACSSLD